MKKRNICLLIIDMQYDFLDSSSPLFVKESPFIIPSIKKVLTYFREKALPVIYVRRTHRADGSDIEKPRLKLFKENQGLLIEGTRGSEIVDEIKPLPSEIVVTKKRFSAFFQTELDIILRRLNIDSLVICGVQTPNCIRATAVDAISFDYDVIVLEDCTASNSREVQMCNLSDLRNIGVKVLKSEDILKK
ncbi:MAG: cysteine hydrolase family protein [Fervidobacterium sp.]